jgi:hypothetical protein
MKYHLRRVGHWYDSPACSSPSKSVETRTLSWARKNPDKVCKTCMKLSRIKRLK